MFPLYDLSSKRTFPFINYAIIALNFFVFYMQFTSADIEAFIFQYGFIPQAFNPIDISSYFYVLTSIFMHGGILHILSNMWFLHIFGDNIEDELGHLRYLIFYIAAGLAATLLQYAIDPSSAIPLIGASGAISGVTGAYFILFRNTKIRALVPTGFFITTADLPASIFLGLWFLIQLVSGFTTYGQAVQGEGGIAWFAHIGGFVFGLLAASLFRKKDTG